MERKKIILKSKIINKLNEIKVWDELDENKFKKSLRKIKVTGKDGITELVLHYIITKKHITLSASHSLFELSEKELKDLIKKDYKVAKVKDKESYLDLIRHLWDAGIEVIPLDDVFYLKTDENVDLELEGSIIAQTQDIE